MCIRDSRRTHRQSNRYPPASSLRQIPSNSSGVSRVSPWPMRRCFVVRTNTPRLSPRASSLHVSPYRSFFRLCPLGVAQGFQRQLRLVSCRLNVTLVARLRTLCQAEKVIGLCAVVLGLEVLVARGADRHDYPHRLSRDANPELPLAGFDVYDRFSLGQFPALPVWIDSAHVGDALVRVVPVALVDAGDLDTRSHWLTPP